MTWREIWHWITTSRYTRRLESDIEFLHAEITRLRTDNDGLLCALYPQVKKIRTEAQVAKEVDRKRPAREIMRPFNSF